MRRLNLKPLATVMGAAALMVAPVALAAPSFAAAIVAAPLVPDETMPHSPELNNPETWEQWLLDEEGIVASCTKEEPIDKPYTIPEIDELFEVDEDDNVAYVLAVLKGGANQEGNAANELYWEPEAGDELSHTTSGNSHVILCIAEYEDETTPPPSTTPPVTTPPVTTPPVTGPVVETDRAADTGPAAGLGLAAVAAALVAGAGAMMFGRRQGNHR